MINQFTFENYRVFKDRTSFKLKPITIFTGQNNSGKSSVTKMLDLILSNLNSASIDNGAINMVNYFDFNRGNSTLGNSYRIINNSNPDSSINLSLATPILDDDFPVEVEFVFKPEKSSKIPISGLNFKFNRKTFAQVIPLKGSDSVNYNKWSIYMNRINARVAFDFLKEIKKSWTNKHESDNDTKDIENINGLNKALLSQIHKLPAKIEDVFNLPFIFDTLLSQSNYPYSYESLTKLLSDNNLNINNIHYDTLTAIVEILNSLTKDYSKEELINQIIEEFSNFNGYYSLEKDNDTHHSFFLTALQYDFDKYKNNDADVLNFLRILIYFMHEIGFNIDRSEINHFGSIIGQICHNALINVIHSSEEFIYVPGVKFDNSVGFYKKNLPDQFLKDLDKFEENKTWWDPGFGNEDQVVLINEIFKLFGLNSDIKKHESSEGDNFHLYVDHMQQGPRNLSDLGFGIGQLIPLLLTFANNLSSSKYRIYIIEEPETSLHPKFQSRLADLFTLYTANSNSNLIIETHSEYLIRKLQYLIAKGEYNSEDVVIYYLDLDDPNYEKRKNKSPQVREITIDRNGRMSQDFGPGFFDEADNIAIQLFNINQQSQN